MATAALDRPSEKRPRDRLDELGIKVTSADDHINEPRYLFNDRFPARLKDKAPRVIEGKDGGKGWSIDGTPPRRTYVLRSHGQLWQERIPGVGPSPFGPAQGQLRRRRARVRVRPFAPPHEPVSPP